MIVHAAGHSAQSPRDICSPPRCARSKAGNRTLIGAAFKPGRVA
jgi:hypothetical protein